MPRHRVLFAISAVLVLGSQAARALVDERTRLWIDLGPGMLGIAIAVVAFFSWFRYTQRPGAEDDQSPTLGPVQGRRAGRLGAAGLAVVAAQMLIVAAFADRPWAPPAYAIVTVLALVLVLWYWKTMWSAGDASDRRDEEPGVPRR